MGELADISLWRELEVASVCRWYRRYRATFCICSAIIGYIFCLMAGPAFGQSILAVVLPSTSQSLATIDQMNELAEMSGIEKAQHARVVLLRPDIFFRIRMSEARLGVAGCNYKSQDKSHVMELIEILRRANLNKVEHSEDANEPWVSEPRESVFLGLPDRSGFLFYFSADNPNDNLVHGYLYNPNYKGVVYLTAKSSIVDALIRWSSGAESSFRDDASGRQSCEYFHDKVENSK